MSLIRKAFAVLALLALLCVPVFAEMGFQTFTATTSSATKTINRASLVIVNDGSGDIYVRVFTYGDTAAAATNANALIKSGENLKVTSAMGITSVAVLSASTSTVRLYYW